MHTWQCSHLYLLYSSCHRLQRCTPPSGHSVDDQSALLFPCGTLWPELDMGWVHPWVWLDWVGFGTFLWVKMGWDLTDKIFGANCWQEHLHFYCHLSHCPSLPVHIIIVTKPCSSGVKVHTHTHTKIWWSLAIWFLSCSNRQTNRHTHHNTSCPSQRSKTAIFVFLVVLMWAFTHFIW